jgi:adenylyltransferase/sulfurtransferase
MEAVKYLTGIGENLKNRLLIVEGSEPRWDIIAIERDPDCVECGNVS